MIKGDGMMSGVHITYPGRKTHFWYACTRKQADEVVRSHAANWVNETVKVDGVDVTRTLPPFQAAFCQGLSEVDGEAVPVEPEPIDVAKVTHGN